MPNPVAKRAAGFADAWTGNTYEGFADGHDGLKGIIFEFLESVEVVTGVELLGWIIEQYDGKAWTLGNSSLRIEDVYDKK